MNRIKIFMMIIAVSVLAAACATTEYNPTCLKECGRGNRECVQGCASLRTPMSEGELRSNRHYRGLSGFDNCSTRCENTYRKCKKRCEQVLVIDAGNQ